MPFMAALGPLLGAAGGAGAAAGAARVGAAAAGTRGAGAAGGSSRLGSFMEGANQASGILEKAQSLSPVMGIIKGAKAVFDQAGNSAGPWTANRTGPRSDTFLY